MINKYTLRYYLFFQIFQKIRLPNKLNYFPILIPSLLLLAQATKAYSLPPISVPIIPNKAEIIAEIVKINKFIYLLKVKHKKGEVLCIKN